MKLNRLARWSGGLVLALCLLYGSGVQANRGSSAPADPVLFKQVPAVSGSSVDASDLGHFPSISSQGADDFVVPNGLFWHISSVTVVGSPGSSGGTIDRVLVQFYGDLNGGAPLYSASFAGAFNDTMVVPLNTAVVLGPGHYWFSAQPHLPCSNGCPTWWLWVESAGHSDSPYAASEWRNPGGGVTSSCPTWQPRVSACGRPSNSSGPDLAFELDGTTASVVGKVYLPVIHR